MKSSLLIFAILATSILNGQSTAETVYSIFQANCTSCHNPDNASGGLDLQGLGSDQSEMGLSVYENLYEGQVQNEIAATKDNLLIYPGDPYRSFMFRKVNNGLAITDVLEDGEEGSENAHTTDGGLLDDYEKEVIRQWILFGAKQDQTLDLEIIESFYDGGGYLGIENDDIPPPPAEDEGFQIHFGPIFVPPSSGIGDSNVEFWGSYNTQLPENVDVSRIEAHIGSSHHMILYKYAEAETANPLGLRTSPQHNVDVNQIVGYQSPGINNTPLPDGTAFRWEENAHIDVNSHVINFSTSSVLANDVYINVYTNPEGTAVQEMKSALLPQLQLNIPNDGEEHVFESAFPGQFGQIALNLVGVEEEIFIWTMASHTHQLGTDFDVWLANDDGSKGEQIYDASTLDGNPESNQSGYDYQHPPARVWSPFLHVDMTKGIVHRASYVNNGPFDNVSWGGTNNDEMMITGIMYVTDTSGLSFGSPTNLTPEITKPSSHVNPNPSNANILIDWNIPHATSLRVFNQNGSTVSIVPISRGEQSKRVDVSKWNSGLYIYHIKTENGNNVVGKFLVQH